MHAVNLGVEPDAKKADTTQLKDTLSVSFKYFPGEYRAFLLCLPQTNIR